MSFCSGSSGVAGYGPRSRVSSRTRASITAKATAPAMTFSRRRMFGCWKALRWMTRYVLDCARWYAGPVDSVGLKLEATWFPSDEHMPSAARHTASGTPCPSSISARWFRWCRPRRGVRDVLAHALGRAERFHLPLGPDAPEHGVLGPLAGHEVPTPLRAEGQGEHARVDRGEDGRMVRAGQQDARALLFLAVPLERAERIEAVDAPAAEQEGLADVVRRGDEDAGLGVQQLEHFVLLRRERRCRRCRGGTPTGHRRTCGAGGRRAPPAPGRPSYRGRRG
jgi:hypothetical protein